MSEVDTLACQRKCWQIAAIGGVVLWLFLSFALGHPLFKALVIAAILALVGAFVLRWALCGSAEAEVPAYQPHEPARVPEPPAAPAPALAEATASESAPVTLAAITPRPDPTVLATVAPAAMIEEPAKPAPKPRATKPKAPTVKAPAKSKAAAPKPAKTKAETASATGLDAAMGRTKEANSDETTLLARPRGGKGDDLKLIVGVGPKLEKLLNDIGVWHFDQIANWKARDIALVDSKMENFKGRISRDGWVKQARALAKGTQPEGKA